MSTARKQPAAGRCADGKRRCQGTHPLICETHGCAILEGRAAAVECRKRADAEREAFAAARGYAALRADVERRLDEARRELARFDGKRVPKIEAFYDGEIAALKWLLKRYDGRKEAPHTEIELSDRLGADVKAP